MILYEIWLLFKAVLSTAVEQTFADINTLMINHVALFNVYIMAYRYSKFDAVLANLYWFRSPKPIYATDYPIGQHLCIW